MTKVYLNTDFYKVSHAMNNGNCPALYPEKIQRVYETLTPRDAKYFKHDDKMVVFGYERFVHQLVKDWQTQFFNQPWEAIVNDFNVFGYMSDERVKNSVVQKFKRLHDYDRLPLTILALPEGTLVPMRVPVLSITNTLDEFYWLPGYLETTLLSQTFVTSTVASAARQFRKIVTHYGQLSADDLGYIDYQCHDFSQRGQHGDEAAELSGLGHLACFKGSDSITAVAKAIELYNDTTVGGSVVATEHSIMESLAGLYGTDLQGQIDAFESLIKRNPEGILSIVSDTYDYWEVIDEVLPALKSQIMSRNGKLVIRPDSLAEARTKRNETIPDVPTQLVRTLEALYETFGGHVNTKGYKVLDPHIGLIHGEGVTIDNISTTLDAILKAGFSAENIVFGVGAFVYSVKVSRDDFGQALKASAAVIDNKEVQIFKKPKSEAESFKRSPKGAVSIHGQSGVYTMVENLTIDEAYHDKDNQMTVLYDEAKQYIKPLTPLSEIRQRIDAELDK